MGSYVVCDFRDVPVGADVMIQWAMTEFERLRANVHEGLRAATRADVRWADGAQRERPDHQLVEQLVRDRETAGNCLAPVPTKDANGGEVLVLEEDLRHESPGLHALLVRPPNVVAAVASRERLELLGDAAALAVDLAESVQAETSLEKAMTHEIASAHALALKFISTADSELLAYRNTRNPLRSVEASRCANTAAKLIGAASAASRMLQGLLQDRRPALPPPPPPELSIAVRVSGPGAL